MDSDDGGYDDREGGADKDCGYGDGQQPAATVNIRATWLCC